MTPPDRSDNLVSEDIEAHQRRLISPAELEDVRVDAGEDKQNMVAPRITFGGARIRSWASGRGAAGIAPCRSPAHSNGDALTLCGWVASHKRSQRNSPMGITDWRKYLEQSAKLLHSLVEKIIGGNSGTTWDSMADFKGDVYIHPKLITSKNVILRELKVMGGTEITADFANRGDSIFCDNGEGGQRKKYRAMDALGRMAYEMFMLGDGPSVSKFCPKSNVTDDTGSSFSDALSINSGESAGDAMEGEEGRIIEALRKIPRTLATGEEDCGGIISAMMAANVPFPMCRFVSDLLDYGDSMLGRSERSFSSFTDVLLDLKQMVDNPGAFLHAASPERWKLAFGDKLYGRDKATQVLMNAADRVSTSRDDPVFNMVSGIKGKRKEVVMVSGFGGAGKSRLVELASASLEEEGWRFLRCKFDRVVHPEPLSILASAFDDYIASLASRQGVNQFNAPSSVTADLDGKCSELQEIRERLKRINGLEGFGILVKHIPSLRHLLRAPSSEETTTKLNETMLHALFGKLLQALSSKRTPILFFADDLQWADPLSLGILYALVKGSRPDQLHLSHANVKKKSLADEEEGINVVFVGSYRDNEVDDDHQLAKVLRKFNSDSSINVTNVSLSGFTLDELNEMLSESLCMPVRRVRSLSELVMQKTDGHPLHVIEFIQALTTDDIMTHSFTRGWEWDADSIDIFPITDSVAELFAFKLRRLPRDILRGLQILSCFGSQIDRHMLSFLANYDGENSVDITAAINVALTEGLVERALHLVRFSHDMIQKAAMESINEDELVPLLLKLVCALAQNASAANELDSVLFFAVDLINRIGSDATSSPRERALFAEMNSRAASKSIAVPDFASAAKYADNGITFLNDTHWQTQYELSLRLYETAALSHFSCRQANEEWLLDRINAVFDHAKDFSDKFTTHSVWVKLLAMTDLAMAIEESLNALQLLGEPLDLANTDYKAVLAELMKQREQFSGERKNKFLSTYRMADRNKMRAMKVMSSLTTYFHRQQSFLSFFVSSQMMEMSVNCGHCEDTVFGAAVVAVNIVNVLEDIEEGSSWARLALSLMEMYDRVNLIPSISTPLYGMVLVWKEPVQSTLEPLSQGVRLSFTSGNVQFANINTSTYALRSLNCGKNISVLSGEVTALARQHMIHFGDDGTSGSSSNSQILQFDLAPLHSTLCDLEGDKEPNEGVEASFPFDKMELVGNDKILEVALEKGQITAHLTILSYQILKALLFREMDSALKYSDMIALNFKMKMNFTSLYSMFYGALIAFHFARETGEERHRVRAEKATLKVKEWSMHSNWNFKNKLLLMEAESLNTQGQFGKAISYYEASIKAAQEHKFIHEEALASELAGIFLFKRGLHRESYRLFKLSIDCYDKWGAHAVVRRIENSIQNDFDSDSIQLSSINTLAVPVTELEEFPSKKRQLVG